jgi:hypothetical protein
MATKKKAKLEIDPNLKEFLDKCVIPILVNKALDEIAEHGTLCVPNSEVKLHATPDLKTSRPVKIAKGRGRAEPSRDCDRRSDYSQTRRP